MFNFSTLSFFTKSRILGHDREGYHDTTLVDDDHHGGGGEHVSTEEEDCRVRPRRPRQIILSQ